MTRFAEIINASAPQLKVPNFIIDHNIKHVEKPFPSVASYIVFVGKSRSGKSSLITSLLKNSRLYRNAFHNVLVILKNTVFTV